MNSARQNRHIALLTLCVGLYYGVFAYFTPVMGDSLLFLNEIRQYSGSAGGFDFEGWWRFMEYMRQTDNCRLDNAVCAAVIAIDNRIITAVTCALTAMLLSLGAWLLFRRNLRATALFLAVVVFLFPWREATMAFCNYMNTMLPAALTLVFISVFLNSRRRILLTAVIALLAGAVHEGYGAATLGGIALYAIARKGRFEGRQWILIAAYALGWAFTVTAPGIWLRSLEQAGNGSVTLKGLITVTMPIILTVVAAIVRFGQFRKALRSEIGIISAGAFCVGAVLAVKAGFDNPRAMWLPALFSTILLTLTVATALRRLSHGALTVASGLTALFCVSQVTLQRKYYAREEVIGQMMSESAHGTVFMDYDVVIPRYALIQPVANLWFDRLHLSVTNTGRSHGDIYCVVADTLRNITRRQARAINSGRNPGRGFERIDGSQGWWSFGKEMVGPDMEFVETIRTGEQKPAVAMFTTLTMEDTDGNITEAPFIIQKFVTASGDSLCWIHSTARGVAGKHFSRLTEDF